MPSKHPATAVRLRPDRRAQVDAFAKDQGITLHAALLELIDRGLRTADAPQSVAPRLDHPKAVLARAEAKAAHLATTKRKRTWSLKGVQLGPTTQEPGSRLDKSYAGDRVKTPARKAR